MTTAAAASVLWQGNLAPGMRMAIVRFTFANTYSTASNTFSATTYGGFDTVTAAWGAARGLPGYSLECGVSTVTITPNLYRGDVDGNPAIVADGVTIGDNVYGYIVLVGV